MTPMHAIRLAMLAGVLLFAGASWVIHRSPGWTPAAELDPEALRMVSWVIWGAAVAGILILLGKARGAPDTARYNTLAIIGWSLGEMTALFGGVIYFLTAQPNSFLIGLLLLVLALTFLPARRHG
jgi:hypothetical protein